MEVSRGIISFVLLLFCCRAQSSENTCKPYEEYRKAGCEITCERIRKENCFTVEKKPGCYCKPGTIRNDAGQCISKEECSKRVCTNRNEILNLSGCFTVCTAKGKIYSGCPFVPIPNCSCKRGFASQYDSLRGNCVPIPQCKGRNE